MIVDGFSAIGWTLGFQVGLRLSERGGGGQKLASRLANMGR